MTIDVLIVSVCAIAIVAAVIHLLTRPVERRMQQVSREQMTARPNRRN